MAAALVPDDRTPSAGASRGSVPIPSVGDGSGPGHDDDTWRGTRAGDERDQRVVDHEDPRARADPPHDRSHHARIVFPIGAGDAQANGGWPLAIAERRLHDLMKNFFDAELAGFLKVGTGTAALREHFPAFVGKKTNGLRAASVDAEQVHMARSHASLTTYPRPTRLTQFHADNRQRSHRPATCGRGRRFGDRGAVDGEWRSRGE